MSIETWEKEYMPVPAYDPSLDTNLKRLEHSLRKWRGFRAEVLEKHGLWKMGVVLGEDDGDDGLPVDASTCALCVAYLRYGGDLCGGCPLNKLTSGNQCRVEYSTFANYGSPEPMILLLERAVAIESPMQSRCNATDSRGRDEPS